MSEPFFFFDPFPDNDGLRVCTAYKSGAYGQSKCTVELAEQEPLLATLILGVGALGVVDSFLASTPSPDQLK